MFGDDLLELERDQKKRFLSKRQIQHKHRSALTLWTLCGWDSAVFESRPESKPGWLLRWDGTTLVFEASVICLHEGYVIWVRTLSVESNTHQFPVSVWHANPFEWLPLLRRSNRGFCNYGVAWHTESIFQSRERHMKRWQQHWSSSSIWWLAVIFQIPQRWEPRGEGVLDFWSKIDPVILFPSFSYKGLNFK